MVINVVSHTTVLYDKYIYILNCLMKESNFSSTIIGVLMIEAGVTDCKSLKVMK